MGKDSAFLEVMKVAAPMAKEEDEEEEEERGDEFELSLELSIGGRYAKSETNSRGKRRESCGVDNNGEINNVGVSNFEISRSGFCCGVRENGCESADLVRRREIQALRRQEARKKREEKLKKSRGSWNGVAFAEDRLFLEAQRSRGRAVERESRERDGFGNELKLSLLSENNKTIPSCLGPNNGNVEKNEGNVVGPAACRSWVDCDSEYSNGIDDRRKTISNRSLDQTSSALSDYQSTSQKGGSSSGDTGTLSSPSRPRQHVTRNAFHPVKINVTPQAIPEVERANNNCSTSENRALPSSNNDAAQVQHQQQQQRMPCVSATGNGPNGRTVIGFLYNYTQAEVSIRCACHGRLFSPTEFVEHAGGVDVTHPLRHITMISYS